MAKTTKKTSPETTETPVKRATAAMRKGTLAYLGLYGAAYEAAQTRFTKVRETSGDTFEDFAKKGEVLETKAQDLFKDAQEKMSETYGKNTKKIRSMLPKAANDRVEKLEGEIKALNKKIVSMTKASKAA